MAGRAGRRQLEIWGLNVVLRGCFWRVGELLRAGCWRFMAGTGDLFLGRAVGGSLSRWLCGGACEGRIRAGPVFVSFGPEFFRIAGVFTDNCLNFA